MGYKRLKRHTELAYVTMVYLLMFYLIILLNGVVFCRVQADYAVVVYSVGVQEEGEEEWDFLWNKAKESRVASEVELMMEALAHTQHPWLLWRLVNKTNRRTVNLVGH